MSFDSVYTCMGCKIGYSVAAMKLCESCGGPALPSDLAQRVHQADASKHLSGIIERERKRARLKAAHKSRRR